jgi:hypothetical protein
MWLSVRKGGNSPTPHRQTGNRTGLLLARAMLDSDRQASDGQRQYVVPLFQRPYSWESPHWATLW